MILVNELRTSLKTQVMGYGHIGDGNIHVNIIAKEGQKIDDLKVYE
jgi:FAD/FMN-containing dehydrogenase